MTTKQLLIAVRNDRQTANEIIDTWHRSKKGLTPEQPLQRLYFDDVETLWKSLTHKRMHLLQILRQSGPLSIRKLAATLNRDYKNVHSDIAKLKALGLVKLDKDELYFVPWDLIDLQIPLTETLSA
jgi:predicted transcriptional regulator